MARCGRRTFLGGATAALGAAVAASGVPDAQPKRDLRVPVIDITDLYHPSQDVGDNVDLVAGYALPGIDLKAVILDVTDRYRRPFVNEADHSYDDPRGGRDPGFIPVTQLNAIFGRNVPAAVGPYAAMRHPEDEMRDAPAFQQTGVELMLDVLRKSDTPVDIVSFGSVRPLAVAYNREPELLRRKVRCAHLCIGGAPLGCLEWNVQLDPHAFVRLLRSELTCAIYPCATERNAVDYGPYNCYWKMENLSCVRRWAQPLQRYLAYAFGASNRTDFLNVLDEAAPVEVMDRMSVSPHNVWETAIWMQVADLSLVRHADGQHRIVPTREVVPSDTILPNELKPCRIQARDDGQFEFQLTDAASNFRIYYRGDPLANQRALQEAWPEWYRSFRL